MKIREILQATRPCFSFEFFPPKTDDGVATLFETIATLQSLQPAFVSVTWGAGGSTRERTLELVTRIKQETGLEAMAHFTCVGASRADLGNALDRMVGIGIENVLALRGDPPRGQTAFVPAPDGFSHSSELAAFIRANYGDTFCIGGACYPEGHIESTDREADLQHTVEKVNAGVEFLITQLFFDNAYYFDFVRRARLAGITVPIIPGIMPITNVEQIERFTRLCGASIPPLVQTELEHRRDQPEAVVEFGVAYASVQCADLLARGAPGIHFYTLNKSLSTRAILSTLRAFQPWPESPSFYS
ncbi:MAG TPA: methylenetetrahydrofolate reductase [NAD(P)H] [Chloroflexota bacterium]|nr:methylenetetrahydrofolate reductase [NAD(P)H] [Chloroflexota bacterium]